MNKVFLHLNLGGGAARGLAHLGVLQALEENQIQVESITGVSMGAIVGAVYAVEPNVAFAKEKILTMIYSSEFKSSLMGNWKKKVEQDPGGFLSVVENISTRTGIAGRLFLSKGLISRREIEPVLFQVLPDIRLGSTAIPFSCVAVNLKTGDRKLFRNQDSLRDAVLASASIPILFPPRKIAGVWYTDGGVLDVNGIESAKEAGFGPILAVDVNPPGLQNEKMQNALDVMLRSEEISSRHRNAAQMKMARFVLRPIRRSVHWADYQDAEKIIREGYQSAMQAMPQIRKKFSQGSLAFLSRLFYR